MIYSILKDTKILSVVLDHNADNETINGTAVDMKGFDSVAFLSGAQKGEELTFSVKLQQDTASAFSTPADLLASADTFVTDAYTDGVLVTEVHHPREQWVRPVFTVPNAAVAKALVCFAILFNASTLPVGENDGELLTCPAEGTA
jgi:hypothetical protein